MPMIDQFQRACLNTMFPNVVPFKTVGGAHRALEYHHEFLKENKITHCVIAVSDGFLPVVILNAENEWCVSAFIGSGRICTTKA